MTYRVPSPESTLLRCFAQPWFQHMEGEVEVLPWIPSPSLKEEALSKGPGSDRNSCHSDTSSSLIERDTKFTPDWTGLRESKQLLPSRKSGFSRHCRNSRRSTKARRRQNRAGSGSNLLLDQAVTIPRVAENPSKWPRPIAT